MVAPASEEQSTKLDSWKPHTWPANFSTSYLQQSVHYNHTENNSVKWVNTGPETEEAPVLGKAAEAHKNILWHGWNFQNQKCCTMLMVANGKENLSSHRYFKLTDYWLGFGHDHCKNTLRWSSQIYLLVFCLLFEKYPCPLCHTHTLLNSKALVRVSFIWSVRKQHQYINNQW